MRAVVKRGSGGIWEKSAEPQPWKGKGHEICVNRKSLEWQNYISQLYSNYFSSLSLSLSFLTIFFSTKSTSKIRPQFCSSPSSRIFSIFVFFFFSFSFFPFLWIIPKKNTVVDKWKVFKSFRGNEGGGRVVNTKMAECLFHFLQLIHRVQSVWMKNKHSLEIYTFRNFLSTFFSVPRLLYFATHFSAATPFRDHFFASK